MAKHCLYKKLSSPCHFLYGGNERRVLYIEYVQETPGAGTGHISQGMSGRAVCFQRIQPDDENRFRIHAFHAVYDGYGNTVCADVPPSFAQSILRRPGGQDAVFLQRLQ